MKKQKRPYLFIVYTGQPIHARREIPYEIKLTTRLLLDELCFQWNKTRLEEAINESLETGNRAEFYQLSEAYRLTIRE